METIVRSSALVICGVGSYRLEQALRNTLMPTTAIEIDALDFTAVSFL
ncbi:MAG: hypothetical protein HOK89_11635 [Rhodospirillaceae bacterium]|nr:hypothetical protein [Rhodospirillaceae bacterium]